MGYIDIYICLNCCAGNFLPFDQTYVCVYVLVLKGIACGYINIKYLTVPEYQ